jgi:hypothetical protein
VNPLEPTDVHASVTARPCADANCTRLGATASDAIVYRLPNELTVRAPPRAVYGKRATFTGTGVAGDYVHVERYLKPEPGRTCTDAKPHFCLPGLGPDVTGNARVMVETRVRDDGTWSLRVPMHPRLVFHRQSLTGRWAGVALPDKYRGTYLTEPDVLAEASADTVVALAKPELRLRRRGSHLTVDIAVDGGDNYVRYTLRFEGKQVDAGRLFPNGTRTSVLTAPDRTGRFDVTVSVRGVEPATSSVVFRP